MQTPRGEHASACKGPEDGVLGRRQESDVSGAERTLERAVGDGVREPEDQAGPCRLLSGFGNLFFLRKEISRKQIWSTFNFTFIFSTATFYKSHFSLFPSYPALSFEKDSFLVFDADIKWK